MSMLAKIFSFTSKVKSGNATLEEMLDIVNLYKEQKNTDDPELIDVVPHSWITWIFESFVKTFSGVDFWISVASKEDLMSVHFQRRFFPMKGSEEWEEITTKVLKTAYPDFDKSTKCRPSNFSRGDLDIKLHTNFGMIPVLDTAKLSAEYKIVERVVGIIKIIGDEKINMCLWSYIATSYEICHLLLQTDWGITFTKSIFDMDKSLVYGLMFYTMYILAHEETTCTNPSTNNRHVFTLNQILDISFLNNALLPHTPWIVNHLPNGNNIYNATPFYLTGDRRVVDIKTFEQRFDRLTHGCFTGLKFKYDNIAIVGSIVTECLSDNALLNSIIPHSDSSTGHVRLSGSATSGMEAFDYRSEMYYPTNGDMTSDIDLAISSVSYKKYILQAYDMIDFINGMVETPFSVTEDCTASGVRFHLTHSTINRQIEIFRTPMSIIKLVSNFHVPCVRMFWNFDQIYMTRGCAASLLTGVNENFNWFSSNKIPADVILKYAQRGFTTILNQKELQCLELYMNESKHWNYGLNSQAEFTGKFDKDHPFFRVDAIPKGIRYGLKNKNVYVGAPTKNVYKACPRLETKTGIVMSDRYEIKDGLVVVKTPDSSLFV